MGGFQCLKAAHLNLYHPELRAEVSEEKEQIFKSGREVGLKAQEYYPGGVTIDAPYWDLDAGVEQTNQAIKGGANTIYEATFSANGLNCRVDILHRKTKRHQWEVIEVKQSTSPKDYQILDVAIQGHILNLADLKWKSLNLMTLNSKCYYPDLSNLFNVDDVTDEADELFSEIELKVKQLQEVLKSKSPPIVEVGRHCEDPFKCDFWNHCWKDLPDYSVFDLPLSWKLFEKGYIEIEDIDQGDLTPSQVKPYEIAISGKREVNQDGIRTALSEWKRPFYHLDFETLGPAIPIFEGTKPFDKVPFQFSLHIQNDFNSKPNHFEYLHTSSSDPRKAVASHLVKYLPKDEGSVVAYNASFERSALEGLAELFPEYNEHLLHIANRLVDPWPVIKENVKDKWFRSSYSIKSVAPALLGKEWSYDLLEVGDGKAAQRAFEEMLDSDTTRDRASKLEEDLRKYCAMDTLAMVELLNWLWKEMKSG